MRVANKRIGMSSVAFCRRRDGADVNANAGDSIEISRGLLGSYWLVTSPHQRFSVTRLR